MANPAMISAPNLDLRRTYHLLLARAVRPGGTTGDVSTPRGNRFQLLPLTLERLPDR